MQRIALSPDVTSGLLTDVGIVAACVVVFIALGAATLPRRSA